VGTTWTHTVRGGGWRGGGLCVMLTPAAQLDQEVSVRPGSMRNIKVGGYLLLGGEGMDMRLWGGAGLGVWGGCVWPRGEGCYTGSDGCATPLTRHPGCTVLLLLLLLLLLLQCDLSCGVCAGVRELIRRGPCSGWCSPGPGRGVKSCYTHTHQLLHLATTNTSGSSCVAQHC